MDNFPKDIYQRDRYLQKIIPFINQQLIKVLIGQRRVGKSYLLFQIIDYIKKLNDDYHIIYINKEDLSFNFIKNANDLNKYILEHIKSGVSNFVFIDEIQDIENFGDALRSLQLLNNVDIYCTGSNANLLSTDIAGHLSGRFIEIQVYSLSYVEFLEFHLLEDSDESLEKYLKFGGLPFLKHLNFNEEVVYDYLKNIYNTIVYKDIINRFSIRSVSFLEQLILFLADTTGSLFSSKKISDFLKSQQIKMAPNQVQTFTNYFVNACLICPVKRFDIKGKRFFEIGEKYYFENLGLRHAIVGYKLEDRGKILENIVFNHLLFLGFKVYIGNIGQKEIDFVTEKNGEKLYIQVALSLYEEKTIEREFGNLMAIDDNYKKIVVTFDDFKGNTYKGIESMHIRKFLKTYTF